MNVASDVKFLQEELEYYHNQMKRSEKLEEVLNIIHEYNLEDMV